MALFQYAVVASVLHDEYSKRSLLDTFRIALAEQGGEAQALGATNLVDRNPELPLFIFVLTGGTEADAMRTIAAERMLERRLPVILLAHSSHNSLPASLEILAKIRQPGGNGSIAQARADGSFESASLRNIIAATATIQAMRSVRIGVVGKPSDWLIASSQGETEAASAWGAQLVEVPFSELTTEIERVRSISAPAETAAAMRDKAEFFKEATDADMRKSMDILEALRTIVRTHALNALTLRCFDLVLQDGSTGCLALSALADEGIDAGCEGDIPSIIGLHWLKLLTGQIGWMANPSRISIAGDRKSAEMLIAHCTSPRSILSRYGLRSHFESGLGVAVAGIVPEGEVTLVRIGGAGLNQLWCSSARVNASPREEGLCRTQAVLSLPPEKADELLSKPLGNHLVMVHGNWCSRIEMYKNLAGTLKL